MKNIETKCITHAPTLLSHKGSAAWAIALKYLYVCVCMCSLCNYIMYTGDSDIP